MIFIDLTTSLLAPSISRGALVLAIEYSVQGGDAHIISGTQFLSSVSGLKFNISVLKVMGGAPVSWVMSNDLTS